MKIKVMSDLHLEFGGEMVFDTDKYTTLVIAGDILPAKHQGSYRELLASVAEESKHVVFCAGNHEFYGGEVAADTQFLHDLASEFDNVHFLDANCITLDGVMFAGGTLWTDMSESRVTTYHRNMIESQMNDFRIVDFGAGRQFNTNLATSIHMGHVYNLEENLKIAAEDNIPVVVVTHHAPSAKSVLPEYSKDVCNPAYYTDLEHLMDKYSPKLWVHGHMHNSLDYMVHNTRVVCNPRGYYGYKLNPNFNPNLEIEIDGS